eukprot:TRINITY_DN852_c0_g1_i1.p1 TRINITY_DN852_c0_g1~~TRINITY_DN852_c0_g1_i1.p1  ORF type:complete len:813 (+),score=190.64 TRINITY_DN852_c0_g1_i1:471-2909(+)
MDVADFITAEDLPYENDVHINAHAFKSWFRYLNFKIDSEPKIRNIIYERALQKIPYSYKMWYNYILERKSQLHNVPLNSPPYESLNLTFERALAYMHKYPRIWIEYLKFLVSQRKITLTRRTFDKALRALPITQHERIWPLYISFAKSCNVPQTAIRIFKRYLKIEPEHVEEYIDYLIEIEQFDEATRQLAEVINNSKFISLEGRSRHELWMLLCDLCSLHPKKIKSIRVEPMIRSGIKKYSNEVGNLWISLAIYYTGIGNFIKARDIYEEAISKVSTMRDFSQIWEAYTEFEDKIIQLQMEDIQNAEANGSVLTQDQVDEFELNLARYEYLIDRQSILISDVKLRQNPNNVEEWHKRVKLFEEDPEKCVKEYTRAFKTIDPKKAEEYHTLWIAFARYYLSHGDSDGAKQILEKAATVDFRELDELASIWCEHVEIAILLGKYQEARQLIQRATVHPSNPQLVKRSGPTTRRLFQSTRLWHLYADLEESLGTEVTTRAVYDKIIDLKIATPATILSYASYLRERDHFEDSFKIYEKGVAIFRFPVALEIWVTYIDYFVDRYGSTQLERLRDMFEQAIDHCPNNLSPILYFMYAEYEEKYGMARHAMNIYERAVRDAEPEDIVKLLNIYIERATENFGVTRTRKIFEKSIDTLPPDLVAQFSLRYANIERRLGEIDRARAIYAHCSQFCAPATNPQFWDIWKGFEVKHGNTETVREMFRIKRSVTAKYETMFNVDQAINTIEKEIVEAKEDAPVEEVEHEVLKIGDDNQEEIDLDMNFGIETMEVPTAVFGSAIEHVEGGALSRLKALKNAQK